MTVPPAPPQLLTAGDFAPWFKAKALDGRADWSFASAAGVPLVLFLMGSTEHPRIAQALARLLEHGDLFDDVQARLFLNDDYEGGDLGFPEFGRRTYRAPKGGAVVFSCSLLHEATPMICGRRYATLPFLYAGAALRVENARYLDESATGPRAKPA